MKSKFLKNRESICAYLDDIGKGTFYKMVRAGLPVVKRGHSWVGHTDKIDTWILNWCAGNKSKDEPEK